MKKKVKTVISNFSNFITSSSRKAAPISSSENFISKALSHSQNSFSESPFSRYDFDEDYYLKRYPDVVAANMNPWFHFTHHGKAEGRRGSPFNLHKDIAPFCETKETVLLVSHDASRTGAPILALNIAQELNKQFNVVVLLLNEGNITSFFELTCNSILSIDSSIRSDHSFTANLIHFIIRHYNVKFSIVNSIASSWILSSLAKCFTPTVLLIHEFAAYMHPNYDFGEAFLWAGITVFPAKIVQKNASDFLNQNMIHSTRVLAQGKSNIPVEPDEISCKNYRIENILNEYSQHKTQSKPFIVLGIGAIEYRKGVDLFVATAFELKRSYPEYNIKMLWIGSKNNSEQSFIYSRFLNEQIKRSDLTDSFELIDELSNIEELYQKVDLFYLSSRLDPLPNVAIDVMMHGKPLICFEKASGIAEVLEQDTNTVECIISHLSIAESTKKIIQFYESPDYYSLISSKIKKLAHNYFDMHNYVMNLIDLSKNIKKLCKQEELDCITLNDSTDFKENFFLIPHIDRQDAIRRYVRSWHNKVSCLRKPTPGFNQALYDFHRAGDKYVEPFADYIRSGKPEGPWQEDVIIPSSALAIDAKKLRCAIHIHVFYADLLQEIMDRIEMNQSDFDLYISTNESSYNQVLDILSKYKQISSRLKIVPNKGRDLGPLLTEFNIELQGYDVIGHIHTKKTLDIKNPQVGCDWFLFLIENLLGGQYRMADQILNEFKKNSKLGLVFADDPNLLDWGKNRVFADELAKQMKLSNLPDHPFNFPVGTMFWARPEAIKPLLELHYSWDKYPEEPLPYDGSILHAIERLIPIIASNQGFTQAVTHISGLTR